MLLLNNSTKQTITNPTLHPIEFHETLILEHESKQDFLDLQANWAKDFPGTSHTITTLREDLCNADRHRRRTLNCLHRHELALTAISEIPQTHWPDRIHDRIAKIERRHFQAQREFSRCLKALQSAHPTQRPTQAKEKQVDNPPEPTPPPEPDNGVTYFQTAEISVVDGKTITKVVDYDAASWLRRPPWPGPGPAKYCRQLVFKEPVIPEHYTYAFTHEGLTYGPARCVFLSYSRDEFMRLCQLEIETNSEHLLDGERLNMRRLI